MGFTHSLTPLEAPWIAARFKEFSGLVGADRWRVGKWRLAAQQQREQAQRP